MSEYELTTVASGQVREAKVGCLYVREPLGDGWWRVAWKPDPAPGTPPFTDRLHESTIATYIPVLEGPAGTEGTT